SAFLVAVSKKLSSKAQRKLAELRSEDPSVSLEVIDAGVLNRDLRDHPGIVRRHFHQAWVQAFCDPEAVSLSGISDARLTHVRDSRLASDHLERSRLLA